jgi:hypothetical protein
MRILLVLLLLFASPFVPSLARAADPNDPQTVLWLDGVGHVRR